MFICVALQSQTGIIITLGVYMSEGASRWGPIAPQPVVSITSLTLVLSISQKLVVHGPYDGKGGTPLQHTSNACLQACNSCTDVYIPCMMGTLQPSGKSCGNNGQP